jgi:uncharacterized damage-inducible protein DinB
MTEQTRPRPQTPLAADERTTLLAFLDFHRTTLLGKTDGLDAAQLAATVAPSTMTLGGLLKHLAVVEHSWFLDIFAGQGLGEPWASVDWDADPDWEWHTAADDDPDELRALLEREIARAREVTSGHDLDDRSVNLDRHGEHYTLRWIVVHMIEEYARHNGHADFLREAVDGSTGI